LGTGLQADFPTKDDLRRAMPSLILQRNLHGIDIDLRCTQIAALGLWLRCQRAYQEMGLKKDRTRITKDRRFNNFPDSQPPGWQGSAVLRNPGSPATSWPADRGCGVPQTPATLVGS
jgi:hypothetical protein